VAILNLTPDSFAGAGPHDDPARACALALAARAAGADAIDLGGESTRPGAARVAPAEQIARVVPALKAMRAERALDGVPISIDTTRAPVAREALDAGADAINDVSGATEDPEILPLAAAHGAGVMLMHRLAPPQADRYSDQYASPPPYADVAREVGEFLSARARAALDAGIDHGAIVLDPGLGFGKDVAQNLALIRATPAMLELGFPILSALSRKSFVGRVGLGRDSTPAERLAPTLALSTMHLSLGARLFRVHDVAEHRAALDAAWALFRAG
jgi:dihydropteroate synthase